MRRCFAFAILVAFVPVSAMSATFTVTGTEDSGPGTLRQAIIDANAASGADVIDFNIPPGSCSAAGVCSIVLSSASGSALDVVTDDVLIDGTTQPRYGTAPANVCATASAPSYMRIQISAPAGALMLVVNSPGPSTIRGLSLSGGFPISLRSAAAHHVACNHIGVNAEGDTGLASGWGVMIENNADGVIIGTDGDGVGDIGERNVFGDTGFGIYINANSNNWIAGNYFCLGADGVTSVGGGSSSDGVYMRQGSSTNLVGTNGDSVSDDIERNIIGHCGTGVWIDSRATDGDNNEVVGNWIGVDAMGDPAGNTTGIYISRDGTNHLVQDNFIGWNTGSGVRIKDTSTLAALSDGNCLVSNNMGFNHGGTQNVVFENNWWNAADGPSGAGSGSGDSVNEFSTGVVDFTPWLTSAPASCQVPEPSRGLLSAVAIGMLASLRMASKWRKR